MDGLVAQGMRLLFMIGNSTLLDLELLGMHLVCGWLRASKSKVVCTCFCPWFMGLGSWVLGLFYVKISIPVCVAHKIIGRCWNMKIKVTIQGGSYFRLIWSVSKTKNFALNCGWQRARTGIYFTDFLGGDKWGRLSNICMIYFKWALSVKPIWVLVLSHVGLSLLARVSWFILLHLNHVCLGVLVSLRISCEIQRTCRIH